MTALQGWIVIGLLVLIMLGIVGIAPVSFCRSFSFNWLSAPPRPRTASWKTERRSSADTRRDAA